MIIGYKSSQKGFKWRNPMKTNTILTALALALCLGVAPQAQGMAYFKAAYHNAYAWGKKATHTALTVKDMALNRMAAIVNHIVPQSYKKSAHSEVAINRINTMVNHLQPEPVKQDNKELKRAQVLVNHIVPNPTNGQSTDINKKDEKPYAFENQIQGLLMWFYNDVNQDGLALIGPEIGSEEIFDNNSNKIGTLYFHKKSNSDAAPLITRFVNNDNILIGFSIASVDSKTKAGAISYLHINQNERRGGLGKILLAYVTKKLYELGCTSFHGTANSFDLQTHENQQQMQTKLEGFYGQFGAQSLDGTKVRLGVTIQ